MLDKIALCISIIGSINWGLLGLFKFDLISWIFGGQSAVMSRIVFVIVALAGIWCLGILFRDPARPREYRQEKV